MCNVKKISIDLLIMEVKNHPSIWDIENQDYKNRKKKHIAWTEICRALFSNFEQLSDAEKKAINHRVQLKWRYIRDHYKRWANQSVSGAVEKFKYVVADQLNFLPNVSSCCLTDDAQTTEEQDEGNPGEITSPESVLPTQAPASSAIKPLNRRETIEPKTKLSGFQDNCSESIPHIEDQNTAFFNSLLPIVCTFDMDENLEFRSEVLHVVQRIRGRKLQHSCLPHQIQPLPVHRRRKEYLKDRRNETSMSFTQLPDDDGLKLEPYPSNQGLTLHLFEEAPNYFRETPQIMNQNTKTLPGPSDEIQILTLSPKLELSSFDDNRIYPY